MAAEPSESSTVLLPGAAVTDRSLLPEPAHDTPTDTIVSEAVPVLVNANWMSTGSPTRVALPTCVPAMAAGLGSMSRFEMMPVHVNATVADGVTGSFEVIVSVPVKKPEPWGAHV